MLCNFLSFVGPCFLLLDHQVNNTCISQCQSIGRELPSFNIVKTFLNEIIHLEKPSASDKMFAASTSKVKFSFSIAVEYDFERHIWVDNYTGESINDLPWASGYPQLNSVLVFGVLQASSEGSTF